MPGPVLYSANPWFSIELAEKYRKGIYFAWVSEFFDSDHAPAGSAGRLIAPSSNPRKIYEDLQHEYKAQEEHPRIIKDHRKTFTRIAKKLLADGLVTKDQCNEIIASVRAASWRIWKPVLYVIPRPSIDPARIREVSRVDRAGYGPELQIIDLKRDEFDIVDLSEMRLAR